MIVSTKEIFKNSYGKYGIAAVNVWCMEQIHALFRAAQKADAPFIVQTTPVARNYASSEMLLSMISAASKIYPSAVFAIHLDHGNMEHAVACIHSGGYNSVMIDASHETFADNVSHTKEIVRFAHDKNITVEAELGVLSGVEDDLTVDEKHKKYTQPEEVEDFVAQTGCDSLAIAIGTSHGAYKFSGGQGLQFDILEEIQNRLPGFPLVLHGGSAVNLDEIQRINAAGGQLGVDAKGVSTEELQKAIEYGVCKINIATDARLIWARVHREFFKHSPAQFDPVVPGRTYMKELEDFNLEKFELLKAIGKASELK
ncbi:class II fructose-bisphosphate aldolase [Sunxiuqinia sp. A32]|uniref:class II fructose-bisphosphate aldolase n=1 Tax=Sunxiuqinia sp. A32 TaxID=3461496 RepID=UPI0040454F39